MSQQLITLVIPFATTKLAALQRELSDAFGNPAKPEIAAALDRLALVHFMGVHALPGESDQSHLVFELAVDRSAQYALQLLAAGLREPIVRLLGLAGIEAPKDLAAFLGSYQQPLGLGWFERCGLGFSGVPGFRVTRIRAEAELAERVATLLEQIPAGWPALEKLKQVRAWLWRDAALKWAFEAEACLASEGEGGALAAVQKSVWPLVRDLLWPLSLLPLLGFGVGAYFAGLATGFALFVLALGCELGLLWFAYRALQNQERADAEDTAPASADALAEILELEDHVAQNHLIVLTPLKRGALRRFTLRVALFAIRQTVLHVFAPGRLADIGTIHFARWIVLPGSSQLLFMSNYGGSWESYLEDFIIKAHLGLTGVWSNTLGFPRASNLFFDGATHGVQFKTWARKNQLPTRFWYSAYPALTTARIRKNAAIRQGIAAADGELEAAAWLALFGGARPETGVRVELDQVPAPVFGGLPRLRHGKSLLLRFDDSERACAWLARVEPLICHGEQTDRTRVLSVAWSARGLAKLGLDRDALASFPVAFQHDSARRARPLGDVGDDAPEHWSWGGTEQCAVDAIALLYASSPRELDELTAQVSVGPFAFQRVVAFQPRPAPGQPLREPFGFVDGISQPILRGTGKALKAKRKDQLLAPGEFILGYPDESSFLPASPQLTTGRDLGKNGSFLVVRQLQQDGAAFRAFVAQAAGTAAIAAAKPADVDAETWIAAKMVGRWQNGSSLVRNPSGPDRDSEPDNDFRYGAEDPDGLACPFGAHIRRANPRDSFDPSGEDPLAVTNRHRILRMGRGYRDAETGSEGLMFMCLNADLERQFEFVQRTWVRAPSFHGLPHEVDPLVARSRESVLSAREGVRHEPVAAQGCTVLTIPTPNGPLVLKGFSDFVRVVGSGYFFLPGRECVRFLARADAAGAGAELPRAAE